ncbi:MAG: type III-B CRISPR module RAMP protein Cmr1 [bacterium JZ-2024 1]
MNAYNFVLNVVTPLVLSGADQNTCEWRAPSIKGLLRWWFRVSGGQKEEEASIFGWAGEKSSRRSKFKISITPALSCNTVQPPTITVRAKGRIFQTQYWGYPLREQTRKCFPPGDKELKVRFAFSPLMSESEKQKVFASWWLAVHLGSFGSRARRGYGVLKVLKCDPPVDIFTSHQTVTSNSLNHITNIISNNPAFSVWELKCSWRDAEQKYHDCRVAIQPRENRAFLGLPIVQEPNLRDQRFASPLWFHPLSQNGPVLITELSTDFSQSTPQNSLSDFLQRMGAVRLWAPSGGRAK